MGVALGLVAGLPIEDVVVGLAFLVGSDDRRSGIECLLGIDDSSRISYSTSISSNASRAEYLSSATTKATSCPWKRTLSVARTAAVSYDNVGTHARPRVSRTAPVMTAFTFGCASAADVSIDLIKACATGLRRIAP